MRSHHHLWSESETTMDTFRIFKNISRVDKAYKVGNCQHKLSKGLKRFYTERWLASPSGPEQPRLPRWMPLLSFFCATKTASGMDLWWHCHWLKLPPLQWSPRVSEFGLWLTLRSLAAVCLRRPASHEGVKVQKCKHFRIQRLSIVATLHQQKF